MNRPGNVALYLGADGGFGGISTYTMSGGLFAVNGTTIVGGRNGGNGTFNVSGTGTMTFGQGLVLGLQDFSQGTVNQTGGIVNIGTGQNISDTNYLRGNNTIDLVLAFNQTNNPGNPSVTRGTYNLNGGELRVNGITTGQGNGYVSGSDAAAGTFTDNANVFTTTAAARRAVQLRRRHLASL